MIDLAIIGGGAAGLMCGLVAARSNIKVTIIDHSQTCGKKILATGNGKCNLSNKEMTADKYYSGDIAFAESIIEKIGYQDVVDMFNKIGVLTRDRNGYIYPYSEQAVAVREALVKGCKDVTIKNNFHIDDIYEKDGMFYITGENEEIISKKLLIATGGKSYGKTGSDGSGFKLAQLFGHTIVNTVPALTSCICNEKFYKKLKGVRAKGKLTLKYNETDIASEYGEIQFTDYGLSGIPVFNVSRIVSYLIKQRKRPEIYLDLMPEYDFDMLYSYILDVCSNSKEDYFIDKASMMLNMKLVPLLIELSNINTDQLCGHITDKQVKDFVYNVKNFKSLIVNVKGFDYAQVTAGGVSVNEVCADTMESKITKGLYFAGEILDVDGICGGYNLHFAWATAIVAANSIISSINQR